MKADCDQRLAAANRIIAEQDAACARATEHEFIPIGVAAARVVSRLKQSTLEEDMTKLSQESAARMADFHNRLRMLTSIDFHELVEAGVVTDDADGDAEWERFRDKPHHWFIAADDETAAKLWTLIERRAGRRRAAVEAAHA